MVQALKSGELDYAHGINADQFDSLKTEPDVTVVNGVTNGWTMLNINSYNGDIPGGGASTTALRDPKFRDALGYAIDKELWSSACSVGTACRAPPRCRRSRRAGTSSRTTPNLRHRAREAEAPRRGLLVDSCRLRLDKDGEPISLRLYLPTDSPSYPKAAAFIAEWFDLLGIKVTTATYDEATLIEIGLPPEAGDGYLADWDLIIWGWTGYADPNPLLEIFTTDLIGSTSDSFYSNPVYDDLFTRQNAAATDEERHELLAQMQNIFYDDAPYHVLFYDDTLVAYRTDTFAGWQNQPANGTPLFGYGSPGYTQLTLAAAASPSPSGGAPSAGASEGPAASPDPGAASSGGNTVLPIVLAVAVVAAIVGAIVVMRRRQAANEED